MLKGKHCLTALSVSTSEGCEHSSPDVLTSVRLLLIIVGEVSESMDIRGSNCIYRSQVANTRPAGRIWPSTLFYLDQDLVSTQQQRLTPCP